MSEVVLKIENVSKQYRLGLVGTGTLSHDLKRWWYLIRGKEDPFLKVGEANDREVKGGEYVNALSDINLEIKKGEVVGIIGKNGAGKSTLLKLLSEVTTPTTGSIKVKGRIAALLEVGTGFHPELTGRENIFLNGAILGMTKPEILQKLDEIIDFAGVKQYIDTPVKRYSSGMIVRLGFSVAAHLEPEILIVDEVLAVGDAEFQKKCIGKMKDVAGEGRTVIFVSHNMASIRNLCDKGIVMDKGVVVFQGGIEEAISKYFSNNDLFFRADEIRTEIPDDLSVFNSGQAKFLKAIMRNEANEITSEFDFRENIEIELNLDVKEKIENVNCVLGILSKFGETIGFGVSNGHNYKLMTFEPGIYQIKFAVPVQLMPGNYALKFGVSFFYSGSSIDHVEYFSPFEVKKETKDKKFEYPWATVHGYIEMLTDWKIRKIEINE
jgi:lipopolysaccharide transport system ATP-binding protein